MQGKAVQIPERLWMFQYGKIDLVPGRESAEPVFDYFEVNKPRTYPNWTTLNSTLTTTAYQTTAMK
jgi:hypothetical protein